MGEATLGGAELEIAADRHTGGTRANLSPVGQSEQQARDYPLEHVG
ncbi:hypothetical protein ACIP79_41925 [Streptomyces sp. NPDC088747]